MSYIHLLYHMYRDIIFILCFTGEYIELCYSGMVGPGLTGEERVGLGPGEDDYRVRPGEPGYRPRPGEPGYDDSRDGDDRYGTGDRDRDDRYGYDRDDGFGGDRDRDDRFGPSDRDRGDRFGPGRDGDDRFGPPGRDGDGRFSPELGQPGKVYNPQTGTLEDFDECELMGHMMCKNGRCINTMGSFRCECDHGFRYDEPSHMCVGKCVLLDFFSFFFYIGKLRIYLIKS